MRIRALLISIVLVAASAALFPAPAAAHTASVSYSHVRLAPGAVDYELRVSSRDLYEALGLERDRDPTDAEILAGEGRLTQYVRNRVMFTGDDRPCDMEPRGVQILSQEDRFVEVRYGVRCPAGSKLLAIHYQLFFDLDPRHTSQLTLTRGERTITEQELSRPTDQDPRANVHAWDLGSTYRDAARGTFDWITLGFGHLVAAYDRIAFLIGLLLVVTIRRPTPDSWETRTARDGAVHLGQIVVALLVAQSIGTIAGVLGWVSIPGRFVEGAIAASVVYVAVENLWSGDPRHRWQLAAVFGLLHGFGFAAALRPQLPPSGAAGPLIDANLGIVLGQVAFAAVLYPILHSIAKGNASTYRRSVVVYGSAVVGLLGAVWLFERIFDVQLLSQYLG